MHLSEQTIFSLIRLMEGRIPAQPDPLDPQRAYFLLFYKRQLELCGAAVRVSMQTDDLAPPSILLRSALECHVDLINLAKRPNYYLVLRAIELDNRFAIFHYKSDPAYSGLVQELGEASVNEMEKNLRASLKSTLQEATRYFPVLDNATHKLNVITRFRIAEMEQSYQNQYTLLSMAAHNALSLMAIESELNAHLDLEILVRQQTSSTVLEFLVGAVQMVSGLFSIDRELIQEAIALLQRLESAIPRLPDQRA